MLLQVLQAEPKQRPIQWPDCRQFASPSQYNLQNLEFPREIAGEDGGGGWRCTLSVQNNGWVPAYPKPPHPHVKAYPAARRSTLSFRLNNKTPAPVTSRTVVGVTTVSRLNFVTLLKACHALSGRSW